MESSPLISIGLPIALFIIMIGIGLTLTARDFGQVTLNPKGMIMGTLAQIVFMPLAAMAIALLLGLSPAIAVGLVIIAACPGGTVSNLFVMLAKGHVALSILLTVSASLITIVTLPFFANFALQMYYGEGTDIVLPVGKTIAMLLVIVLLPVVLGMIIRARFPAPARKVEGWVGIFGGLVLGFLVISQLISLGDRLPGLLAQAGPAAILLNLVGFAGGAMVSRLVGLPREQALAIGVELGIKNVTIALMVTLTLLKSSDMSIPSVAYSLLMFGFGFLVIATGRKLVPATS